jgi:hypothetical protein
VRGIDSEADDVTELRFGTVQEARRRDISIGGGGENVDGFPGQAGDQDFLVDGIEADRVGRDQLRAWTLDDAERRFIATRSGPKNQDGVG